MSATLGVSTLETEVDLDGLDRGLAQGEKKATGWTGRLGSVMATAGAAITAGIAVASAAIVGTAIAGGMAFIGFQNQMNEVFTLLPGISEQAMGQMQEDVKDLSREFGVLPNEVVPALYQALSAGVPQDNVFEFLEIATKASIGGITELETAVDGITSVVNAYGAETIDAQRASDVMFTAVRLGKTDFEQLSSSLFNVIPTAASLGISFEEVAAGLATLTAQGTPTSVATTQLRQLFVELSKSGGDLATVIEEQTGKSFSQLVAEGASVTEILQDVRASMSTDDFRNMFSSVEALNAALGTTGPNFEGMIDNLDDMMGAAGATDAAFDTMSSGMQFTIDRMKAFGQTALLDIGGALAPIIGLVLNFAEAALPKISTALGIVTGAMGAFTGALDDGLSLTEALWDMFEFLGIATDDLWSVMIKIDTAIRAFFDAIGDGLTFVEALWDALEILGLTSDGLWPIMLKIDTAIRAVFDAVIPIITEFVTWKDVLLILAAAVGAVVIPIIWGILSPILAIIAVAALVIGAIALMRAAWENDWGGIQTKVTAVIDFVRGLITSTISWLVAYWAANGAQILATTQQVWDSIQSAIETVTTIISSVLEAFQSAREGDWAAFGENLRVAWDTAWVAITGIFERAKEALTTAITGWISSIQAAWSGTDWGALGHEIVNGIASALTSGAGAIADAARNAAKAALDAAKGFLGISSRSKVFYEVVGGEAVAGLVDALHDGRREIEMATEAMIQPGVLAAAGELGGGAAQPAFGKTGPSQTTYSFDFRYAVIRSQRELEDMIDQALRKAGGQTDRRMRMT